ncbi:MAG TPA: DUF3995 domain-containing protein [Polyangia bacterium]|jgi:hypothetical protein
MILGRGRVVTFMIPVAPLAWLVAAVLAALAAVHLYWALGGRRGANGAIPERDGQPLFRPGPGATLVVAGLLAVASALVLARAGWGPDVVPPVVSRWGTWGVAVVLTARAVGDFNYLGFFKRRRGTRFARLDARFYSPLALGLGIGTALVAWAGR